jgi:hypothetical protein
MHQMPILILLKRLPEWAGENLRRGASSKIVY